MTNQIAQKALVPYICSLTLTFILYLKVNHGLNVHVYSISPVLNPPKLGPGMGLLETDL